MRTRVKIDGRYCDLDEDFSPPRNIVEFSDEEYAQGGSRRAHKVKITLPSSPTNDEIAGFAADAFAAESFNAELTRGVLHSLCFKRVRFQLCVVRRCRAERAR